MKSVTTYHRSYTNLFIAGLLIVWTISGCDIANFSDNGVDLTLEESTIAGQIIGESVSEGQEGLLSSFQEAFAIPTPSGLVVGPTLLSNQGFSNLSNYQYTYDSQSGIHTATFVRNSTTAGFTVSADYILTYKFLDGSGKVISSPDQNRNRIEAVEYKAVRTGEIADSAKISGFTRTDHLFIEGILSTNDILQIDGYHSGEGTFTSTNTSGETITRDYLIEINFLEIQIDKPVVTANRNFRTGVYGAFSYQTTIIQRGNGNDVAKIVNGSIQLNGDGTALLRFQDQPQLYRFQLNNGRVYDEDEFESRIIEVNVSESLIQLTNGQRIKLDSRSRIMNSGDFRSLSEVALALSNGLRVVAEGKLFARVSGQNFQIAETIKFSLESNELEGVLKSVNLVANSFKLDNDDEYFIVNRSLVRIDGRVSRSLESLITALAAGKSIEVEGEFFVDRNTGRRNINKVWFEVDSNDDDDDDDDDDD